MGKVNKSQNVYRTTRTTFLKANRRDPDDFNKPGRITSAQYMPDLHVYVDTSGSISEENYQEAVMMLIRIAKKLNIDLYFNSFSNILSQETLLRVENKSTKQIWKEFRRVPKVTGGTEFKQIWDHINASSKRKRQLSLMITDFEWSPPSTREDHPANLYYAPCSAMDWTDMVLAAKEYADSMKHIDPTVRQKLLGMVA
jgi:predicted metal-dependent peptidase